MMGLTMPIDNGLYEPSALVVWLLENIVLIKEDSQSHLLYDEDILPKLKDNNIIDKNDDAAKTKFKVSTFMKVLTGSANQRVGRHSHARRIKYSYCKLLKVDGTGVVDVDTINKMLPLTSATAYSCTSLNDHAVSLKLSSENRGLKNLTIDHKNNRITMLSADGTEVNLEEQKLIRTVYTDNVDLIKIINCVANLTVCNLKKSPTCSVLVIRNHACARCCNLVDKRSQKLKLKLKEHAFCDGHNELLQCLHDLSPEFKEFVVNQMKRKSQAKPDSYDAKTLNTFTRLHIRDPNVYIRLRESKMLGEIPHPRTLTRYKNKVQAKTGINPQFLEWMADEALNKRITALGCVGGLVVDEMNIQPDLAASMVNGEKGLREFVGYAELNECLQHVHSDKSPVLANQVLQFMFNGYQGFSFPACSYPVRSVTATELHMLTLRIIEALEINGFRVEYVCMDGTAVNRKMIMEATTGYHKTTKGKLYTTMNPCKPAYTITWIMDPKHCIKTVRNSIESSRSVEGAQRTIICDKGKIIWEYWINLFHWSSNKTISTCKRLTNEHIYLNEQLKMRNHLAEEVLDAETLANFKIYRNHLKDGEHLNPVIELLEHTQHLVSIFNDRTHLIQRKSDERIAQLQKIRGYFASYLEKPSTQSFTRPCLQDLLCCVDGILELLTITLGRGQAVNLGFINSDVAENYFCQLRTLYNGASTNPNYASVLNIHNAAVLCQPKTLPGKRTASTYIAPPTKKMKR